MFHPLPDTVYSLVRQNNLWTNLSVAFLPGRAASGGHDSRVLHFRESEIADHDFGIGMLRVVEQILRLQISMDDALLVHVVHRFHHLPY